MMIDCRITAAWTLRMAAMMFGALVTVSCASTGRLADDELSAADSVPDELEMYVIPPHRDGDMRVIRFKRHPAQPPEEL